MSREIKIETIWKWVSSLMLPIITALVSYQTMVIKAAIMKDIESHYVSRIEFKQYSDALVTETDRVRILDSEFKDQDKVLAKLEVNQKNISELLNEVRTDVKKLLERQ